MSSALFTLCLYIDLPRPFYVKTKSNKVKSFTIILDFILPIFTKIKFSSLLVSNQNSLH